MIHYRKHGQCVEPIADYLRNPLGRAVVPWNLHPRGLRSFGPIPSADLRPFISAIGDQSQIGACTAYGTKDGMATSMARAGIAAGAYFAALPLYRGTRCIERASAYPSGGLPRLTDSGACPDDVLKVATTFGIQSSDDECGEAGPSEALSQFENEHVNDEPTLLEFEHDSTFKIVGAFDIVSTGQTRIDDVRRAHEAGFSVGISVHASDDRYQNYLGGVMPDPPAGAGCNHWNYLAGNYIDATGTPIFFGVNSWSKKWGEAGLWRGGPGIIHAADCLIVYSVSKVQP